MYLHTWLVVGHLLGVNYDLLRENPFNKDLEPLTYFEMQLVKEAVFRRHAAPSASGQILTRALLGMAEAALRVCCDRCRRPRSGDSSAITTPTCSRFPRPVRYVSRSTCSVRSAPQPIGSRKGR